MTYQPTVHTLKIGVRGPLGDSVHAEHIGRDTDPALILTMSNTDETLLRPAEWRAFRDAVDQLLGEPPAADDDSDDENLETLRRQIVHLRRELAERDRALHAERERAAAWHDPNDRPDIETPAGPVRSANEVETCETCEGTGRNCWAHGGEADAWRGGGVIADAVTVDADDLDHTKPNPIDRAQRRYEGIDAPAPGVDDRTDPLAHVVPGDPDPTKDVHVDVECGDLADFGGPDGLGTVHCSRESGHDGQHIAGSGVMAVAVWRAYA